MEREDVKNEMVVAAWSRGKDGKKLMKKVDARRRARNQENSVTEQEMYHGSEKGLKSNG